MIIEIKFKVHELQKRHFITTFCETASKYNETCARLKGKILQTIVEIIKTGPLYTHIRSWREMQFTLINESPIF